MIGGQTKACTVSGWQSSDGLMNRCHEVPSPACSSSKKEEQFPIATQVNKNMN